MSIKVNFITLLIKIWEFKKEVKLSWFLRL